MRNWSIITKIVASACGVISVLLLLGSFMLIRFEIRLVRTFIDEHMAKINQTIDDRERQEKTLLRENVKFDTEILSEAGAIYLLNWDTEHLKDSLLRPYINYTEILAIRVLDGAGEPFAAAWKSPEITVGEKLPDDLVLDENLSYRLDSFYEGEQVGSFQVYYTDSILTEQIKKIKQEALVESEVFHAASRSRLNSAIISQSVGVALILLIQIFCLIVLLRALVLNPLVTVSNVARKLAEFDLTVSVHTDRNDEIGKLLKAIDRMVQSFRKVVSQVQRSGNQVSLSAAKLAAAAKQQEAIIVHQAASTDNAVHSVEKISGVAAELEQTMQQVTSMSQETAGFASSSQNELAHMDEVMRQMAEASRSISNRLQILHEEAQNITSVVTTITEVANVTKLLSMNASLEAAKAGGEYGRGFTIIAREVRRLAEQAAAATHDIEQMIKKMQTVVTAGVMEMDKFIADVQHSVRDVGRLSGQLTQIIGKVQALSPNFETVNAAMGLQAKSAQEINLEMVNLSAETQQTMASLRESFLAIKQLNETAKGLQDEVSRFKVS
jgi:methyl-accepting chemotaxis protein WspA